MNLILGAGLSGLSTSFHLGHDRCIVLERQGHAYGHIRSEFRDGFTWDEGPHVSFTKHEYVRDLFARSVGGEFDEYQVRTGNYFRGHWIDHPAQSSLYQVPEPLRSRCLESFLASRTSAAEVTSPPRDYAEWLERAFGPVFAQTFPAAYTRKYWTLDPSRLTTEWVGSRVFSPDVDDVVAGSKGPLGRETHYITTVRYPRRGGYQAFASSLYQNARICFGAEVLSIDLDARQVVTSDGRIFEYQRLINTLPLPVFISACKNVPAAVVEATQQLLCSSVLLVNVGCQAPTARPENWIYVYDEDKLSTRINCTEKLTSGNAPEGHTGVQVEVYFSRFRPLNEPPEVVAQRVMDELREMEIIPRDAPASFHTVHVPWANVVFTTDTCAALDQVWSWLATHGLARAAEDLHPLSDWIAGGNADAFEGPLTMAGRFAQWKYFWTDDCVLRGRQIGEAFAGGGKNL